MRNTKAEYISKRRQETGLDICDCGGVMFELGETTICGDCKKKAHSDISAKKSGLLQGKERKG